MKRMNFPDRKEKRQVEAKERQEKFDAMKNRSKVIRESLKIQRKSKKLEDISGESISLAQVDLPELVNMLKKEKQND